MVIDIKTKVKKRFENLALKLSDKVSSLDDIPEIVMKLTPMNIFTTMKLKQ